MEYDRRQTTEYRDALRRIHEDLQPRVYLEIGVRHGDSVLLAQPRTRTVGIDPAPELRHTMPENSVIVEETSDDFFDRNTVADFAGRPADMTFIDGLHVFDFALRDFRNAERNSHPDSVILFHDCYPPSDETTRRNCGDVWKVMLALRDYRSDLRLRTLLSPPSGLGLVSGLDPANTVLWDKYDEILERYAGILYDDACAHDLPVNPVETQPWRNVRSVLPPDPFRNPSGLDMARIAMRRGRKRALGFKRRNVARLKRKISARGR